MLRVNIKKQNYKIDRYEIIRLLGKGSQAFVYLGRDPRLERFVAIKVLTEQELSRTSDNATPLEAIISSKLNHPSIIPIYDAGECKIGPYLVFEFVEGDTLRDLLTATRSYQLDKAIPMMTTILEALAVAHQHGILHLDLNPRNILVDRNGRPRIMDFGLSQFVNDDHDRKDAAAGTLRYMAPEHFSKAALGTWTDVFALGSTFYEMITGDYAMQGDTLEQIRERIIHARVDMAPVLNRPSGKVLCQFLIGALESDPDGRYTDCEAMREAFAAFVAKASPAHAGDSAEIDHSTIRFLMRRMQRKKDFPAISSTLADINRLAGEDSNASINKLANVVLRDLALTSKLLKIVNSAFYGRRSSEITSISQAVVLLGTERVRMVANSLTLFGALKGDSAVLKESMIRSFLSGLIARHLAKKAKLLEAEEAFISGMCQNLGENLVIYYFADEYEEIDKSRQSAVLDANAASRGVLGVSFSELGAAVAETWNLPNSIVEAINGPPGGLIQSPENNAEKIRDISIFANHLCRILNGQNAEDTDTAIDDLLTTFSPSITIKRDYVQKLIAAGLDKLKDYSTVFEIDVANSRYCRSIEQWLSLDADPSPPD